MFLFKWTDECQKCLGYMKQILTTSPILAYPDPNKQYYLFMDSSKISRSGVLVQCSEQEQENGTKIKYTPSYYISKWNFSWFTEKL